MATGWTIEIGYISGYSYRGGRDEAWGELKSYAEKLRSEPDVVMREAIAFGAPLTDGNGDTLLDYCAIYARDWKDYGPLRIITDPDAGFGTEDFRPHLHIMASGNRELKEHVARAFCRLCMTEMHRKGIEVSIYTV